MDFSLVRARAQFLQGVEFIQEQNRRTFGSIRRPYRAAIWTLAAAVVGFSAQRSHEEYFKREWLAQSRPSFSLLKQSLASFGFVDLPGAVEEQKVGRYLPLLFEDDGAVWWSPKLKQIAWSTPNRDWPRFFKCSSSTSKPPNDWERLGQGWPGFEVLIDLLENEPSARCTPERRALVQKKTRRRRKSRRHPKEWRY